MLVTEITAQSIDAALRKQLDALNTNGIRAKRVLLSRWATVLLALTA